MRTTILAGLLLALLLAFPAAPVRGGEECEGVRLRVVFVPQDELDVLFGGKTRAMLLDHAEYLGLKRLADANPPAPTPPAGATIRRAEYVLVVDGESATGRGRLDLSVLRDGLQKVRLDLLGVGLTSAALDSEPAPLGRDRANAFLAVEGLGDHRLDLGLSCRVKPEDGDRFRLLATLPAAARGFLELRLPGRQEVTTAAPHRTVYPTTDDLTIVGVHLDASGRIDVRWSPRRDAVARLALVHADVRQATVVEDDAVRLDAMATFEVYRKPVDVLRLAVPSAITVTEVRADGMLDWSETDADGRRVVSVRFAAPFTGRRAVRIVGEMGFPGLGEMDLPLVAAPDAVRVVGRVGIVYGLGLTGRVVSLAGVTRDNPRAKTNLEAFAFFSTERRIRLRLERPALSVKATVRALLQLGETSRVIDASIAYVPKGGRLYVFEPTVPEGYEVTHVLVDGKATGHTWERREGGRIAIHLPRGVDAGGTVRVRVRAEAADDSWRDGTVREATRSLDAISAGAGVTQDGVLGVAAFSDFDVRDEALVGFEPIPTADLAAEGIAAVNAVLAYRYRGDPGTGRLVVTRREPKVVARIVTLVAPSHEVVVMRSRVDLEIFRAGIRSVTLRVTGGHGDRVHVVGDGIRSTRRTRDDATGVDLWIVEFQDLRHDTATLDCHLEKKARDGLFVVPEVTVVGIADQAGWIAVESSPGLEIGLETTALTEVEAAQVPIPAGHAVAHGFVAAYRWVRPDHGLALTITRFTDRPVLAAVATSVTLRTRVSREGLARTRLALRLRNTDRQFLEVGLPAKSRLWAALVDGAPVKPLVEESRVLVPLPQSTGGAAREFPLVLVYETALAPLGGKGEIDLEPPALHVAGTAFEWTVLLPDGYEAVRTGGAYREDLLHRQDPLFLRMLRGLGTVTLSAERGMVADSAAPGAAATSAPRTREARPAGAEEPPPMDDPAEPQVEGEVREDREAEKADTPPPAPKPAARPPAKDERRVVDRKDDWTFSVGRGAYAQNLKKGLLSLDIDVTGGGAAARISAVGPAGPVTLVYRESSNRAAWGWFLMAATFGLGLLVVRFGVLRPATWCVVVGAIASTAPLLFDAVETDLWDGIFAGALLGGAVFVGRALFRWITSKAVAASLLAVGVLLPTVANAAPPAPADDDGEVEVLFAPYDPEDPATLERVEKVVISHERFVELWNRAYPDRAIERAAAAPVAAVLTGARYEGSVDRDGDSVRLTARFGIYLPRNRLVEVALPLAPAALEAATLDGKPTRLVSIKGGLTAIVETAGFHTLTLTLRAPIARDGPRGSLRLRVPRVPRASFEVTLPGVDLNVTLPTAGGLETSESAGRTRVEAVLGPIGDLRLAWAPRGPSRDGSLSVTAASRALLHVRSGHADLVTEMKLTIEGGKLGELTCDVGGGLVVREVSAPHLLDWTQEDAVLSLRFRPAAVGSVTVRVTGGVEGVPDAGFEAPSVAPRGLVREAGTLGVHAEAGLTLFPADIRAFRRIAFAEKAFANLGTKGFGPRRLAYRFSRRPATLTIRTGRVRREVRVDDRTHLHVTADAVLGVLEAGYTVRDRLLHECAFDLPAAVSVESVRCDGIRDWWTEPGENGRMRLVVSLRRGFTGKKTVSVSFRVERGDGPVVLPDPHVLGADRSAGLVLLGAPEALELTVTASRALRSVSAKGTAGLVPGATAPRRAYRHDGGSWFLTATTAPRVARIRPLVTTRFVVEDDKVVVDTFVTYEIQGGGARTFRLFVPEGEGEEMIWQVHGLRDRTEAEETVDGVRGTVHRLTLQAEATGPVHVRALYERKIGDGPMRLNSLRALDGDAGRAFVLLQNNSDLLVTPDDVESGLTAGRPADMPYLIGNDQTIFSHAWTARKGAWRLGLEFRRFAFDAYDAAIVTMASLTTVMSPEGWSRNRMTYRVLNRSLQYLEVSLPERGQLEAVLVGGRPVKPARRGDDPRVLIPLRRAALGEVSTEVVIIYAYDFGLRGKGLSEAGRLDLLAPVLHDLPLSETYWELHLPEGFTYDFDGNMDEMESAIAEVQEVLALKRELSFLSTVESDSEGNEFQQSRARANKLRVAVNIEDKAEVAIERLARLETAGMSKAKQQQVARQLDELNVLLADNYAANIRPVEQTFDLAKLREQTRERASRQGPSRARVPILGDTPQLGARFKNVRDTRNTVARGKAGLLKQSWMSNRSGDVQTKQPAAGQSYRSAIALNKRLQETAGVPVLSSTINPADLGRRRDRAFAEVALVRVHTTFVESGSWEARGALADLDEVTSGLGNRAAGRFLNDGGDAARALGVGGGAGVQVESGVTLGFAPEYAQAGEIRGDHSGSPSQEVARGIRLPEDPGSLDVVRAAGVLSLDVPLPTGGRVHRFRKENGGPELTIVARDPDRGRGWLGLMWLVVALGAFGGLRALDRRCPFRGFRPAVVFVLALASAIVAGTVLVSFLVMLGSGIWFTATWLRGRTA